MVERDPASGKIIFNTSEQAAFSLPGSLEPYAAAQTAFVFSQVAAGLVERVAGIDYSKTGQLQEMRKLAHRAAALGGVAAQIFELCPDEHLQVI